MSGWTEREEGSVKIIHHSTSSLIQMLVTRNEEVKQGVFEDVTNEIWFDYAAFSDLQKVINQLDEFDSEQKAMKCPCCESDKTYHTKAIHCKRCAVTTEI